MKRLLPLLLLLPTLIGGALTARSDDETARKADAIYMEALSRSQLDDNDAYFELLRASYELDTTETYTSQLYGFFLMALGQHGDSVMARQGYNLMRRHFDAHPEDYYSSLFWGMLNTNLGNNDEALRVWIVVDSLNPGKPDVAVKLVEALQTRRDSASLRRSLDVLRRIERAEGKDAGLSSHKIRALLALRDTASSIAELNELLASSPRNVGYLLYAGDVLMAIGRPDSAIKFYDRAVEADTLKGLPYFKRGQYYLQRGDSATYDREVSRALRMDDLDMEVKVQLLRDYVSNFYEDSLRRGDIRDLFEAMILSSPHEASIRDLYSSYLIVAGDLKGAAEQQEYAVDADPANADRWAGIMSLYTQMENYPQAIATGLKAKEFLPDDPKIQILLGANRQMAGQGAEALDDFRRAYELLDQKDLRSRSQVLSSIGDIYYADQQADSAFTYYEQAIALDPDNLLALNNFAYFMAETSRDLDRAERYASICVRANPTNINAVDTYAWVFYKKKNYAMARNWIDRALDLAAEEPSAEVYDHAGDIYFMNQIPDKAVEFWQEALRLDPDNATLKQKIRHRSPAF